MRDRYGAKQDRLVELIEQDEREKHEAGECEGAPVCGECLDAQERGEKMKFRKKPVVIEAELITEDMALDCLINRKPGPFGLHFNGDFNPHTRQLHRAWISIKTFEGDMRAVPGDWIIKGIKGELYPCKPDIFDATYEAVET